MISDLKVVKCYIASWWECNKCFLCAIVPGTLILLAF